MFTKSQLDFLANKKLALACSGGIDSMVLADCLIKHKINFSIIHCNFQLRGEASEEDEKFIQSYAEKNKLTLFVRKFDTRESAKTNGSSIEMEARELRYSFFNELHDQENFDLILLAHHLNDQAETIFMRLIKGTGLTGLSGMKDLRDDKYYRPFLSVSKEIILSYAKENKIEFREDESNNETIYQRNKIRNQIFPLIEEINPSFKNALIHLGNLSSQTKSLLNDLSYSWIEIWHNSGRLDLKYYSDKTYLPLLVSYLLDKEILHKDQLEDIVTALARKESKIFTLRSFEIEVKDFIIAKIIKSNSSLITYTTLNEISADAYLKTELIDTAPKIFNQGSLYLDIIKLKFPIQLRPLKTGDKIKPYGMQGQSKKLSDIAQELNWSRSEKMSNKVFLDIDNEIIAILGYRISEKVKLDSNTKQILIIN
jgi:tRNA(Ile)-lysidine synthase